MPTYEYACKQCGEHLEVVQRFTDDPLTECPACQGQLRKVFSPVGITFKGSGFYKTDSRSGSSRSSSATTAASKESSGASSSDASGGGTEKSSSSESAPAASTPSSD